MNRDFYSALQPFRNFEQFTDDAHYCALPDDWFVYITDVVNSTQAIDQGKYKEVNLIGAASITLCINLLEGLAFPFVFGGDGAGLCIPPDRVAAVDTELGSLIRLAADNYALQLRVARIPVRDIEQQGKQVQVAKFELIAGQTLAFFRGGGMELADRLAKSSYDLYAVPAAAQAVEELKGLSCRWSPIPASKACIVSMLVKSRSAEAHSVYAELINEFREVMGQSLDEANPVALQHVRYKTLLGAIRDEYRYHHSVFTGKFLQRVLQIVLSVLIFRHLIHITKRFSGFKQYVDSIREHSDYRKFDDTLRLVLDCSDVQAAGLESTLATARRAGLIHYGLFRSKDALMTCFVETVQDGGHLHFIDGGDGGLAMAARQLKAQLAESSA
jgi:hypothetical protein